jgi:hypothetical protein
MDGIAENEPPSDGSRKIHPIEHDVIINMIRIVNKCVAFGIAALMLFLLL